jgi:hypothetical protein
MLVDRPPSLEKGSDEPNGPLRGSLHDGVTDPRRLKFSRWRNGRDPCGCSRWSRDPLGDRCADPNAQESYEAVTGTSTGARARAS